MASDYGTGAIMGVPAYDERDMEFVRKYKIDIVEKPFNSSIEKLAIEGKWGKKVNYHLRDWLISVNVIGVAQFRWFFANHVHQRYQL